ncbi:MAG: hypothetical protein Q8L48_37765 [Archangium sp.]|nr:hypothetical protein [Archangium sp.]
MTLQLKAWIIIGATLSAIVARPPERRLRANEIHPVVLRPEVLNTVTRSVRPLLIDLYWLRTLNAIGAPESAEKNRSLYEYGRVLTEVDPRFYNAYTYIGLNVPFQTARTTWVNADLAADLYRRGLVQFPNDLRLHLYLGFALFGQLKQYKEASSVFLEGSKAPGAPSFMAPLAARLLAHSGDAEEALALTQELLDSTTDEESRKDFEGKVALLKVEVALQRVDRAIDAFTTAQKRAPRSLEELVESGLYDGPTHDPSGGLISLGSDGRATSESITRRYEVYE